MPTNIRRKKNTKIEVEFDALLHLMTGDCLMGAGCALCDEIAQYSAGKLRMEEARRIWEQQRGALLARWYGWLEERGEPGRYHPVFAEIVFDGAVLPELNPAWPKEARESWRTLTCTLSSHEKAQREQ